MSQSTTAGFQLSPQQKHLWMLETEESAFHATVAVLLEGKLKAEDLQVALKTIIALHELLRTTFERRPGMKFPVQVVNQNPAPT